MAFPPCLISSSFCPGLSLAHYQNASFLFLCSSSLLHIFTFTWAAEGCSTDVMLSRRSWPQHVWFPKLQLPFVGLFLIPLHKTRTNGGNATKEAGFFKKDFIYLFMRDTETARQRHRQREKQAPCREPNVGLDPGTPGSRPS